MPDRLEYLANPERRDVMDYAGYTAQRPASRPRESAGRLAVELIVAAISRHPVHFLPANDGGAGHLA